MRLSRPRVITERDAIKLTAKRAESFGDEVRAAAADEVKQDPFVEKIIKYIPGEIVFAYEAGIGIVSGLPNKNSVHLAWVGVLAVLSYFWTLAATKREDLKPAHFQAFAAVLAFLAWVYAIGGEFINRPQGYASLALIAVTLLIPLAEKMIVK